MSAAADITAIEHVEALTAAEASADNIPEADLPDQGSVLHPNLQSVSAETFSHRSGGLWVHYLLCLPLPYAQHCLLQASWCGIGQAANTGLFKRYCYSCNTDACLAFVNRACAERVPSPSTLPHPP